MNFKQIVLYSIGPIGSAIIGFFTLPIVTWVYDIQIVAQYSIFQAIISISLIFFCLGLDQGYVREYHECPTKSSLFFTLMGLSLLVFCLLFFYLNDFIDELFEETFVSNVDEIIKLTFATIVLNILVRFFSLLLRMEGKAFAYSLSQILPKLLLLIVLLGYFIFLNIDTFESLLSANLASLTFVMLIMCYQSFHLLEWNFSFLEKDIFVRVIKYSAPLLFSSLAFWGLSGADRFYLSWLSNDVELALYSVSASFAMVAVILQSVFSTVWAPQVYKWVSEGRAENKIKIITNNMTLLILILWCFVGMFSWTVKYILPSEYSNVSTLLIPAVAYPLLYTMSECTSVGLNVKRKTGVILAISFICFALNCALNYLLIPGYGASGAVATSVFSFWMYFSLKTYFSFQVYVAFNYLKYWLCITFFSFISIFTLVISSFYSFLIYLTLLFVTIFIFKEELTAIKNKAVLRECI